MGRLIVENGRIDRFQLPPARDSAVLLIRCRLAQWLCCDSFDTD